MTTRSEAQREASRINGAKSRGPTSPEGKEKVRFNGLKHGLRAEEVVLPGEDPAEFEAERQGFLDEWRPRSRTRALLVERLAVAAWRLRRATRADAAYRRQTAEGHAIAFDNARRTRVDRDVDRLAEEPTAAMHGLEAHAAGVERLLATWAELGDALEDGPSGWDRPFHHARLMLLHGRPADADPALIGPAGRASAALLAAHGPGGAPLDAEEAEAAVAAIRRVVAENVARLRARRAEVEEPEVERRRLVDAALVDDSPGAQLRFRYEMALERSALSTIKRLMDLDRSGADLEGPIEPEAAPAAPPPPESEAPAPAAQETAEEAAAAAPGSVGARDARPNRRRPDPRARLREARNRAPKRPREAGATP